MKTKLVLMGCCIALFAMINGCGKSPLNPLGGCLNGNWLKGAETNLTNWSTAANVYSEDPTPANCQNYKNAGKSYLEVLESFADCVPGAEKNEYNEAINELKQELQDNDCNG